MPAVPTFWQILGIRLDRHDGDDAVLRIDVPDTMLSPFGQVHGGVLATYFDTSLAVSIAHRLGPEDRVATHNLNVFYATFTSERLLWCTARATSLRRSVAIAQAEIRTGAGELVAQATGTFGVLRRAS